MFERARDPKHRTWTTENPVRWVKRRRVSKPSKSLRKILRRDEVLPVLAGFPEPSSEAPWRWIAATCIYAGLRPGEALGLHKEDLDTRSWTLAVRHSWSEPLPKDGEERDVPVVAELRPHLLAAIAAARGALVFPRPDGSPRDPETRWLLVDHLRRALKAAGVVDGYRYICRRKGCGFSETREVASEDRCPRCSMRLWVSPVPRRVRFYDLRHTHATLLRRAGVDLGFVQRALGHSSPEITAAIYDHSDIEDFREVVERALTFGSAQVNAPVMQGPKYPEGEGPGASEEPSDSGAFRWSGRLDLNQRPLAPQVRPHHQSTLVESGPDGRLLDSANTLGAIDEHARAQLLPGSVSEYQRQIATGLDSPRIQAHRGALD
jgi:integrase